MRDTPRWGTPLDTLAVRKIGAPSNPEYGLGAVAPGDVSVFDQAALASLGQTEASMEPIVRREKKEVERRARVYRSGAYAGDKHYDTVIIVDDGLATGVTARAAVQSARLRYRPKELVLAVPVCGPDAPLDRSFVDRCICLRQPVHFMAISEWYREFPQVSDEEVIALLEEARRHHRKARN